MLERRGKKEGYNLFDLTKPEWLKPIFKRFTLNSLDDMCLPWAMADLRQDRCFCAWFSRITESIKLKKTAI
ncbi:MAG: hypothetical protein ACLVKR_00585 [Lachnospiraceae bacterium]